MFASTVQDMEHTETRMALIVMKSQLEVCNKQYEYCFNKGYSLKFSMLRIQRNVLISHCEALQAHLNNLITC